MKKHQNIVFFCINGAGMGHLTRCLAYARHLKSKVNCIFFSLASAMEIIEDFGFSGDYFISPFWSVNTSYNWNCELAVRFGMFLERVRPNIVVFDGTWPFQGFLAACQAYKYPLKLVWSKRGLLKNNISPVPIEKNFFDLVLHPGELNNYSPGEDIPRGEHIHLPPVLLLEKKDLLSKYEARECLQLQKFGRYALFSLGAGNVNDIKMLAIRLAEEFTKRSIKIICSTSPISVNDIVFNDAVKVISVYPLGRYLQAFDIFVGAAGYNTSNEVVQTQIPSLIIPNITPVDNQEKRAYALQKYAPVVVSRCESETDIRESINKLLFIMEHDTQRLCVRDLNGAELAANAILNLI